jgi:hypothetical protein
MLINKKIQRAGLYLNKTTGVTPLLHHPLPQHLRTKQYAAPEPNNPTSFNTKQICSILDPFTGDCTTTRHQQTSKFTNAYKTAKNTKKSQFHSFGLIFS